MDLLVYEDAFPTHPRWKQFGCLIQKYCIRQARTKGFFCGGIISFNNLNISAQKVGNVLNFADLGYETSPMDKLHFG